MRNIKKLKLQIIIKEEPFMKDNITINTSREILGEEFIKPMGITANRLAKNTMIRATRISEIVN